MSISLDRAVHKALKKGKTVKIVPSQEYGFHIVVDGVKLTDMQATSEGVPWETLEYSIDQWPFSDSAKQKIRELTNDTT